MELLTTTDALGRWRAGAGARLGLVPTMGNLHAGHMALIERARAACDRVVVSIFVNPLQFRPGEDLETYPRTFDADRSRLEAANVDAVFAPEVDAMYPRGIADATTVRVAGLTDMLCGSRRPGHFEGVTTVVAKLFNLVRPSRAFFGEKDYQQLAVIRRMAADLCTGVDVVGVPIVREPDGLAQSSRNQYLSHAERARAPAMAAALQAAVADLTAGSRDFIALQQRGWAALADAGFEPDYFEIRDATLALPAAATREFRVLAAATLGRARLIDNMGVAVDV